MSTITIPNPSISVDRQSKSIAVFANDFDMVRPFHHYQDEETGVADAKAWLKQFTDEKPKMVYPRVTAIRYHHGKPRKPKQNKDFAAPCCNNAP